MSDETPTKNPDAGARPPSKTPDAEMPPAANPHSPGSVTPKKAAPESGGYERHPAGHSTNNAKGGYGAG